MKECKVSLERRLDGYVAYPVGIHCGAVGDGDAYEGVRADVTSSIPFHREIVRPEHAGAPLRPIGRPAGVSREDSLKTYQAASRSRGRRPPTDSEVSVGGAPLSRPHPPLSGKRWPRCGVATYARPWLTGRGLSSLVARGIVS